MRVVLLVLLGVLTQSRATTLQSLLASYANETNEGRIYSPYGLGAGNSMGSGVFPRYRYAFFTQLRIWDKSGVGFQCGGSLITPNVVITAAHCVMGSNVDHVSVAIGYDRACLGLNGNIDCSEAGLYPNSNINSVRLLPRLDAKFQETVYMQHVVIHPQFDPISVTHDVALIFLDKAVPPSIRPVWVDLGLHYSPTLNFTIMGMGYTQDSGGSSINQLVSTTMRMIDDTTCMDMLKSEFVEGAFCAQGELFTFNGQQFRSGSCLGDSGGPALVTVQPQWNGTNSTYLGPTPAQAQYAGWVDCGWNSTTNTTISVGCDTGGMVGTLLGVTSLGYSPSNGVSVCRSTSTVYAFTRVADHAPWILESIADYGAAHGLTLSLPSQGPYLRVSEPSPPAVVARPPPPPPQPAPPPLPRAGPPPPIPAPAPSVVLSGAARSAHGGYRVAVFNPGCVSQPMQGITLRVATGLEFADFDLGASVDVLDAGQVFVLCGALTMFHVDPSTACDVSLGLEFAPTAQSAVQLMLGGSAFDGVLLAAAAASTFAHADQAHTMVRTHRSGTALQADPTGGADAAPKMWASTSGDISCRPSGAAHCDVPFVAAASCQVKLS